MKILTVAGARPNFIKIAPLHRAFNACGDFVSRTVHTGQHSDFSMSGIFFRQLGLPGPDHFLGIGAGTQTEQIAKIMLAFERTIKKEKPDLIVVVGDVNSSFACALVAAKLHIPIAHVEAGLRCGDRKMPEEINRILIDAMADVHFATESAAVGNLLNENIDLDRIHLVGNVMIDSLLYYMPDIERITLLQTLGITQPYLLLTMHRPQNVDSKPALEKLLDLINALASTRLVIFPVHPRTLNNINHFNLLTAFNNIKNLRLLVPAGYFEFVHLTKNAVLVLTDSGGVQEETTFLRIPCITLRKETERPVTVLEGTNHLAGDYSVKKVVALIDGILSKPLKDTRIPSGWDGNTATRITAILREKYINS
ncbi:non-hydrolyzing UDP-N-acetylglucosamine 2-epimerase [Dyadobacter sp. CY343]|uniref:non-hydrolyzing UDP-N-acetylglucosamine 2-epimerase n=1 Tax=Dyadobacter sp. CY343 TaxID=2907299 RepID=UPI001F2F7955|nr:UDP-N-acetylglucosamine 2-epimerase (non-hydrolyzing) [Dyadobacter sp. CY343]MCE7058800.1 UDP-N-acetylglucosamine 2-epimerase (non-hydrolyzing) [Dyadobacter sp. CY343]